MKPCHIYKEEYKDCKSIKERFNQYFIYGEMQDCAQWNEDYKNCSLWVESNDKEALVIFFYSSVGPANFAVFHDTFCVPVGKSN